ncbi:MAG: prepilin-type N-terminal cleavage/methylation domain-containing protein, partial [bacterium]|nr:prepilin-type N-terminal cleavage/methylation domain-containing protein [bacterium]
MVKFQIPSTKLQINFKPQTLNFKRFGIWNLPARLDFAQAKSGGGFGASGRGGFTIIELLVVLAIISLMTALGFALFSEARAKSRDAKREKDVKTLQDALTIYVTNANTYPTTDTSGLYLTGTDAVSTAIIAAGSIQAMPADPQNTGNFRYQ